ncbi:hypothetical protein J2128_001747 [Methanomicrobium sp. W14]|uniref:hypothetical protein n=1 Tax=Methanomicrobium sp. W14 TaxID=2817839 RepID=UPI001AE2449E|nr:hypothetical protein [Methanomicrobium sp. W14]MBP2133793.1 hypothetical protein [Methanomicrobium sp. W14]
MTEISENTEPVSVMQGFADLDLTRPKAGSPVAHCMEMVETAIRENSGKFTRDLLYKNLPVQMKLPRRIMSSVYEQIIDFYQESGKISFDRIGHVCWVYDPETVSFYKKNDKLKFFGRDALDSVFFGSEDIVSVYRDMITSSSIEEQNGLKYMQDAIKTLEEHMFSGELIPRSVIPRKYENVYGSLNVWKLNMTHSWKLIYSIAADDDEKILIIDDCLNNKDYERLFKPLVI